MADAPASRQVAHCFEQFQSAFEWQNYGLAIDMLIQALRADAGVAYAYFVSRAGAAVIRTLKETGKAAELAEWLNDILPLHPRMNLIYDSSPDQVQRVLDLREANIAKRLPSIVLVTQAKSASVSVGRIFNSGFNLPSFSYSLMTLEVIDSWARDYARGGACNNIHLEPDPHNIARLKRAGLDKVIVHIRDPRQSLLSLIHHFPRYPQDSPVLARGAFDREPIGRQLDVMFLTYLEGIRWIQRWVDAEKEIQILFSTFEDFVMDRDRFMERYIEFYGGPREFFSYDAAVSEHAGTDYHFRRGQIDEWRSVFSAAQAKRLSEWLPETLKSRFGWRD